MHHKGLKGLHFIAAQGMVTAILLYFDFDMRFSKKYVPIASLLLGVLVISGCGQRGPLYLPEQQPEPSTPAATPTPDTPLESNSDSIEQGR